MHDDASPGTVRDSGDPAVDSAAALAAVGCDQGGVTCFSQQAFHSGIPGLGVFDGCRSRQNWPLSFELTSPADDTRSPAAKLSWTAFPAAFWSFSSEAISVISANPPFSLHLILSCVGPGQSSTNWTDGHGP